MDGDKKYSHNGHILNKFMNPSMLPNSIKSGPEEDVRCHGNGMQRFEAAGMERGHHCLKKLQ